MKAVIGLGVTGLSCIDYLCAAGHEVVAMDCASHPAGLEQLKMRYPKLRCFLGKLDVDILCQADEIVVSPGVPTTLPEIQKASDCSIPIIGDIELFARLIKDPVYAITGSNGKTTVTTLVSQMAQMANANVKAGGNIGKPVLTLLKEERAAGYVLELSSFQLETTHSLKTKASVVLNVTEDHMDRYKDFVSYKAAKLKIYQQCEYPIINLDTPSLWQDVKLLGKKITFSVKTDKADYGIKQEGKNIYLAKRGERIMNVMEMPLKGEHHWQNALCALSFGEVMNLSLKNMCDVLAQFQGLSHRCQLVRIKNSVAWYNDSKGTNVGATKTALQSLAKELKGKIILIAGGLGKSADFTQLKAVVKNHVRDLILIGRDAPILADALQNLTMIHFAQSLEDAVALAAQKAKKHDAVLLSPACASFDMFLNYADRGDQFIKLVEAL